MKSMILKILLIIFAIIFSLICIFALFNLYSYSRNGPKYYTAETEFGDVFTVEVYLSGNMHGMYIKYLIYDGDESIGKKNGVVLYVDRDSLNCPLPDAPLSNISTVGKYGDCNFYKIFDMLFYYKKDTYMDSISKNFDVDDYEYYKKDPQCPDFILYEVQAISDLMKSQNFEFIYKYGEIPASDKDPDLKELLLRYAAGDFSDEEKQINADSSITEADMTAFAKSTLEKYYSE